MESKSHISLIVGATALFLGLLHNVLFYEKGIGLNVPLFIILAIAGGVFLIAYSNKRLDKKNVFLLLLPAVFFAGMVFARSSDLLTLFNIAASFLLLLLCVKTFLDKDLRTYLPLDYAKIILLPLGFIKSLIETISKIFNSPKVLRNSPKTQEVIRGVVMAVIAVSIFFFLFASADDVFRKVFSNFYIFELNEELFSRASVIAIITAIFIGVFGHIVSKSEQVSPTASIPRDRRLGAIETMIVLVATNGLFLIFIVLQLAYLFGGESRVASLGITYAEYARKGFFELILVAFLAFLMISVAEKRIVQKEHSHLLSFKLLSLFLLSQVIIILVSAFTRLSLYENAYGFTNIRLYSHVFMVWVGIVVALMAYTVISNQKREKFTFQIYLLSVLFLAGTNFLNPEKVIAKYNMDRYRDTGKLDTAYLASLSDDALPETVALLDDPNEAIRNLFARDLYWARNYDNRDDTDWASLRLPRMEAQELVASKHAQLEANKDIFTAN